MTWAVSQVVNQQIPSWLAFVMYLFIIVVSVVIVSSNLNIAPVFPSPNIPSVVIDGSFALYGKNGKNNYFSSSTFFFHFYVFFELHSFEYVLLHRQRLHLYFYIKQGGKRKQGRTTIHIFTSPSLGLRPQERPLPDRSSAHIPQAPGTAL